MVMEYLLDGRLAYQEQYYINTNWEFNLINTYHI